MLSLADEVIKTRTPKEALKGIHLSADPDLFTARATDLETWVTQTTKVVQVDRSRVALVEASRLRDVAKAMADDAVSLEVDENLVLHVRGAKTHFKLLAMKPTDFPPTPAPDEGKSASVVIKATDLRQMVNQTAFAASRENGEYARAAVLFKLSPRKLELVTADGRRLAKAQRAVDTVGEAAEMVPTQAAKILVKWLSEARSEETGASGLTMTSEWCMMISTDDAEGLMDVMLDACRAGSMLRSDIVAWPAITYRFGTGVRCRATGFPRETTHIRDNA